MDHRFDAPNESHIDDILLRAQQQNIVRNYDTGRGLIVWFEGACGPELRQLRDKIRGLLPADWFAPN